MQYKITKAIDALILAAVIEGGVSDEKLPASRELTNLRKSELIEAISAPCLHQIQEPAPATAMDALREAEAALEVAMARILKADPGHSICVTSEAKALVAVRAALAATPAADAPAQTIERQRMTAGRASFFMERFLREEKLLGPNEQAALHFVIDMLEAAAAPVVLPHPDAPSSAPILRAMSENYSAGHLWDTLDAQTCLRAANEIDRLHALLAGVSAPAGVVNLNFDTLREIVDGLHVAWCEAQGYAYSPGSEPYQEARKRAIGLHEAALSYIKALESFSALSQADALDAAPAASEQDARHIAIGKAIERACTDQPEDTEIIISLERGAGSVSMLDPDGNEHDYFQCDDGFAGVVNQAIDAAIAAQAAAPTDEPVFLQRLRVEQQELDARQQKLGAFIESSEFRLLSETDAALLSKQEALQHVLLQTLNQRIHSASEKHMREKRNA